MGAGRVRLGVALIVLGTACAWPVAGSAQVLYRTSGRISRLTVSGGRMAWAERVSGTHCIHIMRRRVVGSTLRRVTRCYAAALVRTASGAIRIRAYSAASGVVVRSVPVRSAVLPMLAMVGPRVVFAYPRRIMAWNVRGNGLRVL